MSAATVRFGLPGACWQACAALFALGCTDPALSFGNNSDYYFRSDHESADFADWTDQGENGGFLAFNGSRVDVEAGRARSGEFALHVRGASAEVDWTTGMVARNRPLPNEAYYSAWFYLPEAIAPRNFWILFLFRSRPEPSGDVPFQNELSLFMARNVTGDLRFYLETHAGELQAPVRDAPVPLQRWFQLEAFQRVAADASGRCSIWLDDVQLYDYSGPTAATPHVEWMLGVVVDKLDSPAVDLYIDDAAITRHRLGNAAAPFVRE